MKTPIAVAVLLLGNAVHAEDHATCPHRAGDRRAAVDHRHDNVSAVAHEGSVHHFLITKTGGTIRLEVTDPGDAAGRDRIRRHLQVVTRSFAVGDFSLPMFVHGQVPPGVEVMKTRKEAIRYAYAPTERGGEVRIVTDDDEVLKSIHEFLRFQIDDHGTEDPKK